VFHYILLGFFYKYKLLYKNKYRIGSTRLKNWNYGSNGYYFITICTHNRKNYFGVIKNNEMILSDVGQLAQTHWDEIPKRFIYASVDAYIIMPNHIHGIIRINKSGDCCKIDVKDAESKNVGGITKNHNPMLQDNLSRIIRWYKGRVTFESRKINSKFKWQSLFHDHIIRDDKALSNIQKYIENNPQNYRG